MKWFKKTSRQDLFRTHSGIAFIRSAAKQALSLETSTSLKLGRRLKRAPVSIYQGRKINKKRQSMTLYPENHGDENAKELTIANRVIQNPFLERYANLIDNLALSSLPPEIENDIIVHMSDSKNATVEVQSMNIKFTIVEGNLCVYPREEIAQRILCGTKGQQRAIFFNSSNNKWLHGCNVSFELVDSSISLRPGYREITASTKDLREALGLEDSVKLDITHYFKFLIFYN